MEPSFLTRLRTVALIVALFLGTQAAAFVVQFPLAALARPLIDRQLVDADAALGFNWLELYRATARHPWLLHVVFRTYDGLLPFGLFVVVWLAVESPKRAWRMAAASVVATIAVLAISAIWPAIGPVVFFHAPLMDMVAVDLSLARAGVLAPHMVGLVTFPSYHAALPTLAMLALPRAPVILGGALIIAATPVAGGHYLVDVIAGLALALATWWVAGRMLESG